MTDRCFWCSVDIYDGRDATVYFTKPIHYKCLIKLCKQAIIERKSPAKVKGFREGSVENHEKRFQPAR